MMNVPIRDTASPISLCCEICEFDFSTYPDFYQHHLSHIRKSVVRLVKLNPSLTERLRYSSYKLNTGVARRSGHHVSPLKISLRKQPGKSQFRVIKTEKSEAGNSPRTDSFSQDYRIKLESKFPKAESNFHVASKSRTVEGKSIFERLGATISITRKGVPVLTKVKDEPADEENNSNQSNASNNSNDSNGSGKSAARLQAENLLKSFQGKSGIVISQKPKVLPANGNPESENKSIPNSQIGKVKAIDINQLRNIKPAESPAPEKKPFDRSILEKLSSSGISFAAPKRLTKPESPKVQEESEEESKDEDVEKKNDGNVSKNEEEESDEKSDVESSNKFCSKNGSQDGYDSSDSKSNLNEESNKSQTDENSRNENDSETEKVEPQKRIRVKNSLMKKDFEKKSDAGSSSEEQESNLDKDDEDTRGSGFNILKGLTDDLAVGLDKQGDKEEEEEEEDQPKPKLPVMEEVNLPPSPPPSEQFEQSRPDFIAPPSECNSPAVGENQIMDSNNTNIPNENQPDCSMMITPPSSTQDSNEGSSYNSANCDDSYQSKDFEETPTINDDQNQDVSMSFTSLQNEDQSQVTNDEQPTYWSDVRDGTVDQPQQDPLMTGDGSVNNGEMNQSYLQIFQNESDPAQNSMPPEGSEFMQYDELAQHQQQSYNAPGPDPNAPMEQLSQQVNRMPNPPGQINVIPQHHMQAPQPPQLHPGMPISPQHMAPQQNQYDPLGHMQPPMPPPLYQGYNMFNQNFAPQAPQMPPRPPPMLQQMPQRIQPRPFQSMAAIPTRPQRPRGFPMKRNMVRLPGPQEMTPPKVRRVEPPMQQRQQMQQNVMSAAAKIPSGITVTPPKKTIEANKAANVLAARGITVTPAANRQQQQNAGRAQQQQQQRAGANVPSPIINLGSSISITPSSQNRSSGGFAVPGPRRNAPAPMVNHNVERPERCMTVDLTMDEEPPQMQRNRGAAPPQIGRFSCNQCTKIFTSSVALESHKASHRAATTLAFKCDRCTAAYPTAVGLQQHKLAFHKANKPAPDLAIPIVDLHHPGAREQLGKCGIHSFLPLSQLQSNSNGYFGIPIINLDSAKEKAVSNLNILGAGNIFVLGKMKTLTPAPNR